MRTNSIANFMAATPWEKNDDGMGNARTWLELYFLYLIRGGAEQEAQLTTHQGAGNPERTNNLQKNLGIFKSCTKGAPQEVHG